MKLIRACVVSILTLGIVSVGSAAWATPGAPAILSPHEGDEVLSASVEVSGTADPDTFVHFYDATLGDLGVAVSDASGQFAEDLSVPDGSYSIRARAMSIDGAWGPYSSWVSFTVDLPPAKPAFTKPTSNARTNNPIVLLEGTAETGSTVTLLENGSEIASDLPLVSGTWSTTITFAEGAHTVTAIATDARGRDSAPASRTFTVDTIAPGAPAITTPVTNACLGSRAVHVAGTAEPNAQITILEGATTRKTVNANGNGDWSTTVANVPEGAHTYTARAKDQAGNTGPQSPGVSFTVDATAPTVTIATADNSAFVLGAGEIAGTATDDRTGVVAVELHYKLITGADRGTRNATCAGCIATSVTWTDAPAMAPGYYSVEATAIDRAGNRSAPATINFAQVNP